MNVEANLHEFELLQQQFEEKIHAATRDKIENHNYTKEGLRALVEAAIIQQKLRNMTTGAAAEGHRKEYLHLIALVHGEMERMGLIVKRTPDDTISLAILVAFLSGISLIIFCNTPCGTSAGFFPSVENFSHDGAWP